MYYYKTMTNFKALRFKLFIRSHVWRSNKQWRHIPPPWFRHPLSC